MTTAQLALVTALFALLATSAFGQNCCGRSAYAPAYGDPYGGGPYVGDAHGPGPYQAYGGGADDGQGWGGDVYTNHFGPGFHRNATVGHYRFPYYSYRRPWYHPGPPVYNADTGLPW